VSEVWNWIQANLSSVAISVVVAVAVFILQSRPKRLVVELTSSDSLVIVREDPERRLEVRYDGRVVDSVHLLKLRVRNSGKVP